MPTLAAGLAYVDLKFLQRAEAIATVVVHDRGGVALIDPGPKTTIETLELGLDAHGLRLRDVTDIVLTHVHLDHAGATGALVTLAPHVRVHVHAAGAPHLIDPTKLVASARRLWGDDLERLWGVPQPVPERHVRRLHGGERLDLAGRTFDVAYTPGHAVHHVSLFDRSTGIAFVGDTAGMAVRHGYVLPPTPPPDIDLDAWRVSVARIEQWGPSTLFLTHFGTVEDVRRHLAELLDNLDEHAALARESLRRAGGDGEQADWFVDQIRRRLSRTLSDAEIQAYEAGAPLRLLWLGLARYWRQRGAA